MDMGVEAINNEINILSTDLISKYEHEKVMNKIESNLIFSQISVLSKAMNLGYYELLGDAEKWNKELEIYRSIQRADILNTACKIFQAKNQNTLLYNRL